MLVHIEVFLIVASVPDAAPSGWHRLEILQRVTAFAPVAKDRMNSDRPLSAGTVGIHGVEVTFGEHTSCPK